MHRTVAGKRHSAEAHMWSVQVRSDWSDNFSRFHLGISKRLNFRAAQVFTLNDAYLMWRLLLVIFQLEVKNFFVLLLLYTIPFSTNSIDIFSEYLSAICKNLPSTNLEMRNSLLIGLKMITSHTDKGMNIGLMFLRLYKSDVPSSFETNGSFASFWELLEF